MGRVAGLTAEQAKKRLLAAAAEVFMERGYEGMRTGEIARRAGLSTGAIYSRYGSKAELICEAIAAHAPGRLAELFQVESGGTVVETIRELGAQLPERPREMGVMLAQVLVAAHRDPQLAGTFATGVGNRLAGLEAVAGLAQRDGDLDPSLSTASLARLCMAIVFGSHFLNAMGLAATDGDDWAAVIDRVVEAMRTP